jgi:hypothetical protein
MNDIVYHVLNFVDSTTILEIGKTSKVGLCLHWVLQKLKKYVKFVANEQFTQQAIRNWNHSTIQQRLILHSYLGDFKFFKRHIRYAVKIANVVEGQICDHSFEYLLSLLKNRLNRCLIGNNTIVFSAALYLSGIINNEKRLQTWRYGDCLIYLLQFPEFKTNLCNRRKLLNELCDYGSDLNTNKTREYLELEIDFCVYDDHHITSILSHLPTNWKNLCRFEELSANQKCLVVQALFHSSSKIIRRIDQLVSKLKHLDIERFHDLLCFCLIERIFNPALPTNASFDILRFFAKAQPHQINDVYEFEKNWRKFPKDMFCIDTIPNFINIDNLKIFGTIDHFIKVEYSIAVFVSLYSDPSKQCEEFDRLFDWTKRNVPHIFNTPAKLCMEIAMMFGHFSEEMLQHLSKLIKGAFFKNQFYCNFIQTLTFYHPDFNDVDKILLRFDDYHPALKQWIDVHPDQSYWSNFLSRFV